MFCVDQPMGDDETRKGALNRCKNCFSDKEGYEDVKYVVGIEGGATKTETGYDCFGWICVMKVNEPSDVPEETSHNGTNSTTPKGQLEESDFQFSFARTATLQVPPKVCALMEEGEELGLAVDKAFERKGTGKGFGVVGVITNGVITRTEYYRKNLLHPLLSNLVPNCS